MNLLFDIVFLMMLIQFNSKFVVCNEIEILGCKWHIFPRKKKQMKNIVDKVRVKYE